MKYFEQDQGAVQVERGEDLKKYSRFLIGFGEKQHREQYLLLFKSNISFSKVNIYVHMNNVTTLGGRR